MFVRTKIRSISCFARCATADEREGVHGDISQGSRDGVMLALKGGRVPILVATDVAARGLDITTVTHVINTTCPPLPTPTCIASGAPGGGTLRARHTFVEPREKRELEAIERHIGTSIEPWQQGVVGRPRRCASARAATPAAHLARRRRGLREADGGRRPRRGIRVADIVGALTSAAGLDGEAVRDVFLFDRFSFVSVPATEAVRVCAHWRDTASRALAAPGRVGS